MYDLINKRVVLSRFVIFHESNFPFLDSALSNDFNDSNSPPLPIICDFHDTTAIGPFIASQTTTPTESLHMDYRKHIVGRENISSVFY